jgi:protocatechuate 4,5-dioxygenase alpha chain
MAASMTGMSQEDYAKMMLNGGRSPDGNRYLHEQPGAAAKAEQHG